MNNLKEMVINALRNNANPIFTNLLEMAEKNDTKGLENFARNYCNEKGRNFDEEIKSFKDQLKNFGINYKK